jgi:hypothetical protein
MLLFLQIASYSKFEAIFVFKKATRNSDSPGKKTPFSP